jgi:SAM-dependent methyltransferase
MDGAEPIRLKETYPCLFDKTSGTGVDSHYFYQHVWAMEKIVACRPALHVDVGSNVDFVGLLGTITKVQFVDIRPMQVSNMPNLESKYGSILELPYEDNSLESISCLHVAEHIGLGRYGDPLDPLGTKKAAAELSRCLKPGGNLYFSLPVGKPRLQFNAHRIHSPKQIVEYFSGLKLLGFSGTNDKKEFIRNANIEDFENQRYSCGMFLFTKTR